MKKKIVIILFSVLIFSFINADLSDYLPKNIEVKDNPNDDGTKLDVTWEIKEDALKNKKLTGYSIWVGTNKDSLELTNTVGPASVEYTISRLDKKKTYYVKVSIADNSEIASSFIGPVKPEEQWFNTSKINVLAASLLFTAIMLYFISSTKKGRDYYIRPIAGIDAVEEAVGRATEMGKPILYIPGLSDETTIATIASFSILGKIAVKAAEYETPILVPNRFPVVMAICQEVVKESYLKAGRPDSFNKDNVFYVTQSQFGYAAGVNGVILREKPATIFYLGMFWAESLILAETGAQAGAIQIAGTDSVTQIPFFIAACDYTLMGEELYAASVYLSKEPILMSTLKAQDISKLIIAALIVIGSILFTYGNTSVYEFFAIK